MSIIASSFSRLLYPAATMLLAITISSLHAAEPEIINLWPDRAPNETKELPPEAAVSKPNDRQVAGKPVIRLGNVSVPQLTIYRPSPEKDTGAAFIICPGGGHSILAYDLEGTEVAEWLTGLGVTGIVLKYRVPARDPQRRWGAAVQDGQRAVSVVRSNAEAWGLKSDKIGVLGFSAGGETAGRTALMFADRQYEPHDAADQVSCRPDFAVLIYPAYMANEKTGKLLDDVPVSDKSPPMFLVHAWDDRVTPLTSLLLATELKKANVSVELHLYATGGHGYGLRQTEEPCTRWPELCEAWLRHQGIVK